MCGVWMYGFTDAWMKEYMDVWIEGCRDKVMYRRAIVWIHRFKDAEVWMNGFLGGELRVHEWMDGWMDVCVHGCVDVWLSGCLYVWIPGWTNVFARMHSMASVCWVALF